MKYNLDIKSLLIGVLGTGLLISTIGFKSNGNNSSDDQDGKFKAVVGEKGVVILNTQTGEYIIGPDVREVGTVKWIKGDFYSTHKASQDNKKEYNK